MVNLYSITLYLFS